MMNNNLYIRIITGLLFLPIFYLVAWKLSPAYFTALVMVAAAAGQYEFYRMARARGSDPNATLGIVLGVLVVLEFYQPPFPGTGRYFTIAACVLAIMVGRLFSRRPVEGALEDVASTFLGVFYVALLFAFQVAIRVGTYGKQWLVFLYFVIWASDIGAYSIGIPFGKHRLYEKVSPKKSIEGLIGALAAAAGMAALCRLWFMPPVSRGEAVALGLVLAAVGTIGDLAESLYKRAAGVKDSGGIIPGHGGMLDRMDSMLFAAPVLYFYLGMR
jgi:phosphatidate cytidylyltransferase